MIMLFRWLAGRGAPQKEVDRQLALLTPAVWQQALLAHDFLRGLSATESQGLKQRAAWLLASKSFIGAQGLQVSFDMQLSIALQAALPVLHLDPRLYEGWTEIIVYPAGFLIPRTEVDEAGVVHEYIEAASGEAWEGGPIVLSWEDAQPMGQPGVNVVIHEFVHKLDLHSGDAQGVPSLAAHPDIPPALWLRVLQESWQHFEHALTQAEDAVPHHVDPESEEATVWFEHLPLDPYAATDTAEFFAVSAEAFFIDPRGLAQWYPSWYGLLSRYFRQDPMLRLFAHS
jgi:Mlc titration factor MtfA (ptsG expression regulator)